MSDIVNVPFGDSAEETATLLLAAVEDTDHEPSVVVVNSFGGFNVPKDVADKAGVKYQDTSTNDGSKYTDEQIEEASNTPLAEPKPEVDAEGNQPGADGDDDGEKKQTRKRTTRKQTEKEQG